MGAEVDGREAASRPLGGAPTFATDLRDATAPAEMVDKVGSRICPIDVPVNFAGAAQHTPPAELDPTKWHAAFERAAGTTLEQSCRAPTHPWCL